MFRDRSLNSLTYPSITPITTVNASAPNITDSTANSVTLRFRKYRIARKYFSMSHSYLRVSTGLILAARHAGYRLAANAPNTPAPKNIPIITGFLSTGMLLK